MKATQRDFANVAPKAAAACKVFFFCGQDEAGASAAADRIVSLLEGGYSLQGLASGTAAHVRALMGH